MSPDAPRPLSKRSVLDRAKNAGVKGDEALRDLALNQLLARIDTHAPGRFMLKGAQALRVRQVSSRATHDLDIRSDAATIAHAVDALRGAMSLDLGDGILFQVTREPSPLGLDHTGGSIGVSVGIEALLQGEFIAPVSIDLVTGRDPSGRVALATCTTSARSPCAPNPKRSHCAPHWRRSECAAVSRRPNASTCRPAGRHDGRRSL